MSKKALIVWFDDKGNLLQDAGSFDDMMRYVNSPATSYANVYSTYKHEEAKDFPDTMNYISMYDRYRGNARVKLKSDITGREYTMFLDDFDKVIKARRFINNQIQGDFHFMKKGMAQVIQLVLPKPAAP